MTCRVCGQPGGCTIVHSEGTTESLESHFMHKKGCYENWFVGVVESGVCNLHEGKPVQATHVNGTSVMKWENNEHKKGEVPEEMSEASRKKATEVLSLHRQCMDQIKKTKK